MAAKAEDRLGWARGEVSDAAGFGAGLLVPVVGLSIAYGRTAGWAALVVGTVALLTIGLWAGRTRGRWLPLAGMVLALAPCWLLASILGAPGALPD